MRLRRILGLFFQNRVQNRVCDGQEHHAMGDFLGDL